MKTLLALLLVVPFLYAADFFWEGDADTDWSNGDNWFGGSAPGASDRAVFHGDSADGPCVNDAAFNIDNLYMDVSYDQTFDDGGFPCSTVTGYEFGGATVAGTFTGDWYITGNGNAKFATGMTYTVSAMDGFFEGQNDSMLNTSGGTIKVHKIVGAGSGDTTHVTPGPAASDLIETVQLTLGAGVFDHAGDRAFDISPTGANDLSFNASHEIISTGAATGTLDVNINGVALNLPQINASGFTNVGGFRIFMTTANAGISQQGSLTVGGFTIVRTDHAGAHTWNTNNHNITIDDAVGLRIAATQKTLIVNMGSSAVVVSGGGELRLGSSAADSVQINMQTSTWAVDGNVTIYSATSGIDGGTSTLTCDGTAACTFRSSEATEPLYDVVCNKTGNGVTLLATVPLYCNTLTITDGDFDLNGETVTTTSDQSYTAAATDAVTLDAASTMTGNGDFTFASSAGTFTTTSAALNLEGTGDFTNSSGNSRTIQTLTCAANTKTTTITATNNIYLQHSTTPLICGGGVLDLASGTVYVRLTAADDLVTLGGTAPAITGTLIMGPYAADIVTTQPAFTATGAGPTTYVFENSDNSKVQLTGAHSTAGSTNIYVNAAITDTFDFNGQNFEVTGGAGKWLAMGTNNASATFVVQLKGAALDLADDFQTTTYNDATTRIEADSGSVNYEVDFSLGSGTDWVAADETITADGTGAQVITLNTDTLGAVVINKGGNTASTADDFACFYLDVDAGAWDVSGDDVVVTNNCKTNGAADWVYDGTSLLKMMLDGGRLSLSVGDTLPKVQMFGTCYIDSGGSVADLVMPAAGGDSVIFQPDTRIGFVALDTANINGADASNRNAWVSATATERDTVDFFGTNKVMNFFYTRDQYYVDTLTFGAGCLSGGGNY